MFLLLRRTPWNRTCSDALRRMLPLLERATFTPAISPAQLTDEQTRLLANIHATYKVRPARPKGNVRNLVVKLEVFDGSRGAK